MSTENTQPKARNLNRVMLFLGLILGSGLTTSAFYFYTGYMNRSEETAVMFTANSIIKTQNELHLKNIELLDNIKTKRPTTSKDIQEHLDATDKALTEIKNMQIEINKSKQNLDSAKTIDLRERTTEYLLKTNEVVSITEQNLILLRQYNEPLKEHADMSKLLQESGAELFKDPNAFATKLRGIIEIDQRILDELENIQVPANYAEYHIMIKKGFETELSFLNGMLTAINNLDFSGVETAIAKFESDMNENDKSLNKSLEGVTSKINTLEAELQGLNGQVEVEVSNL